MQYSIGIDIGGTKIAAGIVNKEGEVVKKLIYPTPVESSQKILELLKSIILMLSKEAQKCNLTLVGIGIGSAGQIDSKKGIVLSGTDNISDWNGIKVLSYLSQFTDLSIFLDNDANTFAIAEYLLGSGKSYDNLIGLTLGTGIGGGVIVDGKLLNGEWGGAGELGHMTVNMEGPRCNCGSRGCIETYASGTGIANSMKKKLASRLIAIDNVNTGYDLEKITSKQVFEWYKEEVPEAKEVINTAKKALSFGIINLIHIFNPKLIVLGGGIIEKNPWFLKEVQSEVYKLGIKTLVSTVEFSISGLGNESGLIGAAQQVWLKEKGV